MHNANLVLKKNIFIFICQQMDVNFKAEEPNVL